MFILIISSCIVLAIPTVWLSYKLVEKRFLGTVFNSGAALMFAVSGSFSSNKTLIFIYCSRLMYASISIYLTSAINSGLCRY